MWCPRPARVSRAASYRQRNRLIDMYMLQPVKENCQSVLHPTPSHLHLTPCAGMHQPALLGLTSCRLIGASSQAFKLGHLYQMERETAECMVQVHYTSSNGPVYTDQRLEFIMQP